MNNLNKVNMQRFFISVLLALCGLAASAQMMPDSTVQICAYWSVGDKYDYYVEESTKKVNSQGDTVSNELSSRIMRFEVVGSTDSSHQIRLTYLDEKSTNPQNEQIYQISRALDLNIPILFSTDANGVLLSIDNLGDIVSGYEKLIDPLMEIVKASVPEAEKEEFDFSPLKEVMRSMLCNPQTIQTGIMEDIGRLYFFHGARLEMDETYKMEEPLLFILPGIDNLTAQTNVWIEGDLTDEYSAVCRTYSCAEMGEDFLKSAIEGAANMTLDAMEVSDSLTSEIKNEIDEMMGDKDISYQLSWEQYSTEEVHLSTGWPLKLYIDKYMKVTPPEGETEETIESKSIEIIL